MQRLSFPTETNLSNKIKMSYLSRNSHIKHKTIKTANLYRKCAWFPRDSGPISHLGDGASSVFTAGRDADYNIRYSAGKNTAATDFLSHYSIRSN